MSIEATSRVTSQNQISVPAEIRRHFGIGPGSELVWEEREGMLVVRKKKYTIEDVQAALGPPPAGRNCLILAIAKKNGALPLATFDAALAKLEGTQKLGKKGR